LDDVALAGADRAGLREAEEALVLVEDAAPAALRAGTRRRAGPGPAAVAGRAGGLAGEVDRGGDALDRVVEVEVQLGFEVLAAVGPGAARRARRPPPTAAEQTAEEIAEILDPEACGARTGAGATRPAEHAAGGPEPANLVVLLALLGVADHVVGGGHLLEALLGGPVARVVVRVVAARQLAIRALDVLLGGGLAHPEDPVVVLLEPLALRRHRPVPCPFASLSRAP